MGFLSSSKAEPNREIDAPAHRRGEALTIWVIWLTYGSFYFCRQNIAAAVPGLTKEGLTYEQKGLLLGSLKLTYAIGQLVNGQLAERFSPRKLLAVGMLGSAGLSALFGFSTGVYFLIFIWACNGYCQSLGWTPCMKVAANWVPAKRRGRAIGIIGTSYQLMASVTFVVSGYAAEWLGWRGAMYVPAVLLALSAVYMLMFLREQPDSQRQESAAPKASRPWQENLKLTLRNPALWVLAGALFFLDACRYGFTDWGLTHLTEVQETGVGQSAIKYAILPAGGIVGALLSGWLTDRFFAGRRAPVICTFMLLLGCLTLAYDHVTQRSQAGTAVLLFFIGMAIFGAQVLLVGTAPSDLARSGTAAAAAGFVNFMGYLGASFGDQATGFLKQHHDWRSAIYCWAAWSFIGAAVIALLWRVRPGGSLRIEESC